MNAGCGGDNPAAKAAGTAVVNVLLGFAKSVANAASDAVSLIAPQEGQPLQAFNPQQAVGMVAGGIVVNALETAATDGEKVSTLEPGLYAKESIPGHMGRPTASEQKQVNVLMEKNGCH